MAETNGVEPTEYSTFTFGNEKVRVSSLTLWHLQEVKEWYDHLGAGLPWIEFSSTVLKMIAFVYIDNKGEGDPTIADVEAQAKAWSRKLKAGDALEVPRLYNEWLLQSGFKSATVGEEEAASLGTGTSTELSPNSPPEESAGAILN